MYDFKYAGLSANEELGFLFIESMTISPLMQRNQYLTIDFRDGAIDNSYRNDLDRKIYDNRVITISTILTFNGVDEDFQEKYNKLLMFLYTPRESNIELSNCKGVRWLGSFTNLSEGVRVGDTAYRFVIQFTVHPFSSGESVELEEQEFSGGTTTYTVNNIGTAYTDKIVVKITGTFETFSMKNGNKTLYYNAGLDNGEILILDFEDMKLLKDGVEVINDGWTGSFFELKNGINNIEIYTNGICNVQINYMPKYIYSSVGVV